MDLQPYEPHTLDKYDSIALLPVCTRGAAMINQPCLLPHAVQHFDITIKWLDSESKPWTAHSIDQELIKKS
jgi:hypothetical protein